MKISIIAAVAANGVIGWKGRLPWHLPADLQHFRRLTMGHALIVGRKTFESIGRPLPGRRMIVLTRNRAWHARGVTVVHSLDEALRRVAGEEEVFVGGGCEVYAATLPMAERLYLTQIERDFEGDRCFPPFDERVWRLSSREPHSGPLPYTFLTYARKKGEDRSGGGTS